MKSNAFEGLKVNFIGDSLFGGHTVKGGWIKLFCEKHQLDYNNYGINGCTLSACKDGSNPIIHRYTDMADNDPDLIIFEGGRNDFNKCAEIGSVEVEDETTYCGAIALLVKGLKEKYPRARIAASTFWNTGTVNKEGRRSNEYVEAMIAACEELGVPYINSFDESASGVYMTDREFRERYCVCGGDVCHLNEEGMEMVLPFYESEIARLMELR